MAIRVGPVAYGGGVFWDESECGDLVQIFISHGTSMIYSLQFQYVVNGTLMLSKRYGESNGLKFDKVRLNYPSEFITCVDGHISSSERINSLTFHTNKGKYGPFGSRVNNDTEFIFHTGGFHGKTCNTGGFKSIGVYIKPLTAIRYRPNIKVEPTHQ